MRDNVTPTPADDLRAALAARAAVGLPAAVSFKWETETSGPAWIDLPDGETVPLAVHEWGEDAEGLSSCGAWFPFSYVRDWARRVGATVEEW